MPGANEAGVFHDEVCQVSVACFRIWQKTCEAVLQHCQHVELCCAVKPAYLLIKT